MISFLAPPRPRSTARAHATPFLSPESPEIGILHHHSDLSYTTYINIQWLFCLINRPVRDGGVGLSSIQTPVGQRGICVDERVDLVFCFPTSTPPPPLDRRSLFLRHHLLRNSPAPPTRCVEPLAAAPLCSCRRRAPGECLGGTRDFCWAYSVGRGRRRTGRGWQWCWIVSFAHHSLGTVQRRLPRFRSSPGGFAGALPLPTAKQP